MNLLPVKLKARIKRFKRWTVFDPGAPPSEQEDIKTGVTDKERFDLGIDMMKSYYDAIEARLAGSVPLYVVVIGWLIASKDAHNALAGRWWLVFLGWLVMTLVLLAYWSNIKHWLERWHSILLEVRNLKYMPSNSYIRYTRFSRFTFFFYLAPILLLYAVIVILLLAIGFRLF